MGIPEITDEFWLASVMEYDPGFIKGSENREEPVESTGWRILAQVAGIRQCTVSVPGISAGQGPSRRNRRGKDITGRGLSIRPVS